MAGAVIWGDRLIAIKRHASTSVDVEGRPVAGNLSTVVSVKGYLFHVDNTLEIEGRYVVVSDVRALLPNGVNIATSDLLEASDTPGVYYRVKTITPKRSPFGGVATLAIDCEAI